LPATPKAVTAGVTGPTVMFKLSTGMALGRHVAGAVCDGVVREAAAGVYEKEPLR